MTSALLPAYGQSIFSEYVAFLPLAVLALAVIGAWGWRTRAGVIPALALAAAGLFLALGAYNPLYWLLARLPGFGYFRAPARWLVLYALGLSLLAGIGWQLLWHWAGGAAAHERTEFFRRRILPPLLLFFLLLFLLAVWGVLAGQLVGFLPTGPEAPYTSPSMMTVAGWLLEAFLIVACLLAAAYLPTAQGRRIALSALLLAGLAAGFLASRTLPYNNLTTPEAFFDLRPSTTRLLAEVGSPPERMLSLSDIFFDPGDQAEIDTIYAEQLPAQALYDYTIAIKQKEINAPNLPMIYGLASVDGFDGGILPLRSYSQLMSLTLLEGQETVDGRLREHLQAVPEARWLDLFNARYLITDKTRDLWLDGVYFDRQHPLTLAAGQRAAVGYLPQFETDEIQLLSSAPPGEVEIITRDGVQWRLRPEFVEGSLYRVRLPQPALLDELMISACAGGPCTLEAVTLIDTRDNAFQSVTAGAYQLIHSGDVKIYENLDVLPRAYLVADWQWAADTPGAVEALRDPQFDGRQTAVLTGEEAALPSDPAAELPGQAVITSYSAGEVVIETNAPSSALLVLTDTHYPGWEAEVDGQPATVFPANLLFRGVFVPEGEHQVILRFTSLAYRRGLMLFILTLAIIASMSLGLALFSKKNR